jgi:predicted membrane channel-forming protein YqfA (hemolysin III family)
LGHRTFWRGAKTVLLVPPGYEIYAALPWDGLDECDTGLADDPSPAQQCCMAGCCGGLTYTVGVIFYKWESLRFSNAIWHGFVLSASACFFAAIVIGELAQK